MKTIPATAISLCLIVSSLATAEESTPLFNGKDLTGWTGADYEVKDGVLICSGKVLRTEKQYSNYVFEFDFLLPKGGNNGIGIHYPGEGRPSGAGMELQILDNTHPKYSKLKESQYHGSLYKLQAAKRGFLKPVGEWNHQLLFEGGRPTAEGLMAAEGSVVQRRRVEGREGVTTEGGREDLAIGKT